MMDYSIPTFVNISGGRTSAYMAYLFKDKPVTFIFQNTGRERPETYDFLRDIEKNFGIKIIWLQYKDTKPFFDIVDYETADRTGKPFEQLIEKRRAIPNKHKRFCTIEMKVKTSRRYIRSLGIKEYNKVIGFRTDEIKRWERMEKDTGISIKEHIYAPLIELGITAKEIAEFWKSQSFDLKLPILPNGKTFGGNCMGCFWHSEYQNAMLCKSHPDAVEWLIKQEEKMGYNFMDRMSWKEFKQYVAEQKQSSFDLEDFYCTSVNGSCGI